MCPSELFDESEPIPFAGNQQHQSGCQAGRQIIGGIVKSRRHAAKFPVAFRLVSNHGVERINHFVCHHSGKPEQEKPEHRGDDPVAQVLGERFQCGRADFLRGEAGGVPSDNPADLRTPGFHALFDSFEYGFNLLDKRFPRQAEKYADCGQKSTYYRMNERRTSK